MVDDKQCKPIPPLALSTLGYTNTYVHTSLQDWLYSKFATKRSSLGHRSQLGHTLSVGGALQSPTLGHLCFAEYHRWQHHMPASGYRWQHLHLFGAWNFLYQSECIRWQITQSSDKTQHTSLAGHWRANYGAICAIKLPTFSSRGAAIYREVTCSIKKEKNYFTSTLTPGPSFFFPMYSCSLLPSPPVSIIWNEENGSVSDKNHDGITYQSKVSRETSLVQICPFL